jgi:hypothetical protein
VCRGWWPWVGLGWACVLGLATVDVVTSALGESEFELVRLVLAGEAVAGLCQVLAAIGIAFDLHQDFVLW